jgi:hypothetical protein
MAGNAGLDGLDDVENAHVNEPRVVCEVWRIADR